MYFRLLFILLFSFNLHGQSNELFGVEWTFLPNDQSPKTFSSGDSLVFIVDDTTDFNPKITLSVTADGDASISSMWYSYPTVNGIIVDRSEPESIITISRDTIRTGGSVEIREFKTETKRQHNHGPALYSLCILDLGAIAQEFSCGIAVGFGSENTYEGPFSYYIRDNRLILIKK